MGLPYKKRTQDECGLFFGVGSRAADGPLGGCAGAAHGDHGRRGLARFEARRFPRYDVEYLSRLRAGASYASVVETVRDLTRRPELNGRCTVVVDATGVGLPVVEMLRATDLKARVVPVTGVDASVQDVPL